MTKKATGTKAKAWEVFARFIKVRDCIATTTFPFVGHCVTCDKRFHIKSLQAGHLFPGRSNAKLFQEEVVNAQCFHCNVTCNGRIKRYRKRMEAKYTVGKVEKWEFEGDKVIRDRDMDFPYQAIYYKAKWTKLILPFRYRTWNELLGSE